MPEYPWTIYRMSEGPLTTKEVHQGVNEQLNRKLGTDWGYSEYEWANLLQGFRPLPIRTASGTIAHFSDGADDVPMKSITANIVPIQSGTGTPSPSNPRPISGTSVLNVKQTGKNLFDAEKIVEDSAHPSYVYIQDGYLKFTTRGADTRNFIFDNLKFPCPLTFKGKIKSFSAYNNSIQIRATYSDGTNDVKILGTVQAQSELDFSTTIGASGKTLVKINGNWTDDKEAGFDLSETQLELGSTATTYEPYTGSTTTVNLGQTVYGGTADVVGGVGEKNKTGRVLDGTEAWFLVSSGEYTTVFALGSAMSVVDQNEQICSHFNFNSQANAVSQSRANTFVQGTSGNLFIQVSNDLATTVEGFKSWLTSEYANGTPVSYVAKTTPTEYTFTGQPINSYLGTNNVWTDSGEVLDIEYRSNF